MEVKSLPAIGAMTRMEAFTKRRVLGFKDILPVDPELKTKKVYMQSPQFLNDPHNVKMFGMFDKLMELKDKIAAEIVERNKSSKDELVQGANGYSRIKKYLDINPKMNYSEERTFYNPTENEYYILRNYKLHNESRAIRNHFERTV